MRILVDGLPLLGQATIGRYLAQLLRHLAELGEEHEYRLFFRAFRADTRRRVREALADPRLAGFPVRTTRVPNRVLEWCWTRRGLRVPLTEAWLGWPDVFVATIYLTPVLRGPGLVLLAYDLSPLRFPQLYGADQPLLPARLRRGIERADALIAISEFTKREFVELLGADPARVHVIYPGVDARFGPAVDAAARDRTLARHGVRRPYLLYVGVLAPHKNVGTLVRVFRRLKAARRLPHQLVLCGRAAWGRETLEAARDLIGRGDCVALGFAPNADVPHLYHGADAFAFLSLYEGFGLPVAEAMACGVPVVTSNAGSLSEVAGDAALQVPPTDEAAIEAALDRVLTEAALREELRARGFRQAARFAWPEAARQTLKVLAAARGGR